MLLHKLFLILGDLFFVNITFFFALFLRFDADIPTHYLDLFMNQWLILTLIHFVFGLCFKLYKSLIRYISLRDFFYLCVATFCSGLTFFIYGSITDTRFPRTVYAIYLCVLTLTLLASRCSPEVFKRALIKLSKPAPSTSRILIIGAGDASHLIISELKKTQNDTKKIIISLDDDRNKWSSSLDGIPIKGPIDNLVHYATTYSIDEIIVCIPSTPKSRIKDILSLCSQTSCSLKIFPGIPSALSGDTWLQQLRNVSIEDLLGRDELSFYNPAIEEKLQGHTILITGGGGSIGSELCRQISRYKPKQLVIFDIYENNAYDIQNELLHHGFPLNSLHVVIGSVRDDSKLHEVFAQYKPHIIFHAAAHKHVPLMEHNPSEAIKNNIFGTWNVAQCAIQYHTSKFILISTDKAVNPTNVMGATKRFCEMMIQTLNPLSPHTDFVAVRFGNVLGSNGSVIPLFKRQLEAGGPLTVTHPEIIRYFMTIPEAVNLILQATSFAKGGEIFVLDMGEPVKILDLAVNFIKLSGFEPFKDIDIIFTGLRPGEKLYEELLMEEEGLQKTASSQIFIGKPLSLPYEQLLANLDTLKKALLEATDLKSVLQQVVPTYHTSTLDTEAIQPHNNRELA